MKKLNLLTILLACLALCALPAKAQTNTPTGSFFSTVTSYFTSFNPDLESTFATQRGEFSTGIDSIGSTARTGALLANNIRFSYDLYHPTNATTLTFSAEAILRNSGVAGTLTDTGIGGAVNFIVHDAKLSLYFDGFYDFTGTGANSRFGDRLLAEIGLRAEKALTANTFAGVSFGVQVPSGAQVFGAFAGFKF